MYDSPEVAAGHRERSSAGRNPLSCSKARYYNPQIGRFISEDPMGRESENHLYNYADLAPSALNDPAGLMAMGLTPGEGAQPSIIVKVCCDKVHGAIGRLLGKRHCFIRIGYWTYELQPSGTWPSKTGEISATVKPERGGDCAYTGGDCKLIDCINKTYNDYPNGGEYGASGPNSNTFAGTVARKCKLNTPGSANDDASPGWTASPPSPPSPPVPPPPPPVPPCCRH